MDRDQKAAITKMAARYQIQAETLDRVLAGVKSYDEAAKVISERTEGTFRGSFRPRHKPACRISDTLKGRHSPSLFFLIISSRRPRSSAKK